jgi:hypothetical protein
MTDHVERIRAAFRPNLEQQRKLAKDLLKAAKAGDPSALARLAASGQPAGATPRQSEIKLTSAQFAIARELGFASWSELKSHIAALDRARSAIEGKGHPPDAGIKTLHLRCGSDIQETLIEAGFSGDFLEVSYPYCHGPVTTAPDRYEREARFIAEFAGEQMGVSFEAALARRHEEERGLAASAHEYERIVLWMEHDCFDQMVLVRCLAHYATTAIPRILELICINRFPGSIRFIGLGQLPAEAIRLLWERRQTVTSAQLGLASDAWQALTLDDPRRLAALMRTGTSALPDLSAALHRQLQELPSVENGLSLTERLILQILSDSDSVALKRMFGLLTYERDPLPFSTDLSLLQTVERMEQLPEPTLKRSAAGEAQWNDELSITDTGRAVLRGERDFLSLQPSDRWVGGVHVRPGTPTWRWNEKKRDAVLE